MAGERSVYVGCSFPGVEVICEISRKGKHRAFCSCGWQGPRRRRSLRALEDERAHVAAALPAERPFAPEETP